MNPAHKPHEQLRTEAPVQKEHNDKYVSAFISGEPNVDMSFRSPVLSKSSDHFKVGIDELTVNLTGLSMLEVNDDVVFRIIRRGYVDNVAAGQPGEARTGGTLDSAPVGFQMPDGPAGQEAKWRNAFTFKADRVFNTLNQFVDRCKQIATAVGSFVRSEGYTNPANPNEIWNRALIAGQPYDHFAVSLTPNGQLRFSGNKLFWANFVIEFPTRRYREVLLGDPDQQFISLDPITMQLSGELFTKALQGDGTYTYTALGFGVTVLFAPDAADHQNTTDLEYETPSNLLCTLDRRVTLEVGCSLPLQNSPMVDHGDESPDYVLGRYMFHQPYTLKSSADGAEILMSGLGCKSVQGPRDRIVYHHLQPQQKIQILRIRLWARVRTYDKSTRKWGMKSIQCPTNNSDYWHVRLHFVEK